MPGVNSGSEATAFHEAGQQHGDVDDSVCAVAHDGPDRQTRSSASSRIRYILSQHTLEKPMGGCEIQVPLPTRIVLITEYGLTYTSSQVTHQHKAPISRQV